MEDIEKMQAFQEDVLYLEHFVEDEITYEMCLHAAKTARINDHDNRSILHFIPEKFRTYEVCEYAVTYNGRALNRVLKDMLDYSLCMLAMKAGNGRVSDIPRHLFTKELCKLAVEDDPYNITGFPREFLCRELVQIVKDRIPHFLEYPHNRWLNGYID